MWTETLNCNGRQWPCRDGITCANTYSITCFPRLIVTAAIICKSHQLFAISLLAPLIGNVFSLIPVPHCIWHCFPVFMPLLFFFCLSLSLSTALCSRKCFQLFWSSIPAIYLPISFFLCSTLVYRTCLFRFFERNAI